MAGHQVVGLHRERHRRNNSTFIGDVRTPQTENAPGRWSSEVMGQAFGYAQRLAFFN